MEKRTSEPTTCHACGVDNAAGASYCRICGERVSGRESASLVGHRIGDWELTRLVGRGGLGEAYLGTRTDAQGDLREAVLKVPRHVSIDPRRHADICRRLHEEAETLRSLDHRHIVPFLDILPYLGGIVLVMRHIPGLDLASILARAHQVHKAPPSWEETAGYTEGIFEALHYAHSHPERPILHGDVKPSNILIEERTGAPWLIDFGLSRALDDSDGTIHLGTMAYSAPEVLEGRAIDTNADVFSLGATLYELLTGRPPFPIDDQRTAAEQAEFMGQHPPQPLSEIRGDLPTRVHAAVHKALAFDPAGRFQSCLDFHAALFSSDAVRLRTPETHEATLEAGARFGGYRLERRAAINPLWETWFAEGLDNGDRVWIQIVTEPRCRPFLPAVEDPVALRSVRLRRLRARNPWYHPPYLVQRALTADEESLEEFLARETPGLDGVLSILGQVLMGLRLLHSQGSVHGHLSPGTVIRSRSSGNVSLLGLGMHALVSPFLSDEGGADNEQISRGFGDLAPEQVRDGTTGTAADVFAAGRLAVRLLGLSPEDDLAKALERRGLSALLTRVLSACLQPEPRRRPSADALLYAAREHAGGEGLSPGEASYIETAARVILAPHQEEDLPDPEPAPGGYEEGSTREIALLYALIDRVGKERWQRFLEPYQRVYLPEVIERRREGLLSRESLIELEGIRRARGIPRLVARLLEASSHPDALDIEGIPFVQVPGGTLDVGSEQGRTDEAPRHQVSMDRFLISKGPITTAQYGRFIEETAHPPRAFPEHTGAAAPDEPAAGVSWDDAFEFCRWLSQRSGHRVELPTEAQWEHAASGGMQRSYPWGDADPDPRRCRFGDPNGRTGSTGYRREGASPFGLHDMAGNVWEWCRDWYDEVAYRESPLMNPAGPRKGTQRVLRGGSYMSPPERLRCTARDKDRPEVALPSYGFRVVIELD